MWRLTIACLAVVAAPARAQDDKIVWTDGSVTTGVKVQEFTWDKVTFRNGTQIEQRSADAVADLVVARVAETYRRGYHADDTDAACDAFTTEADRLVKSDPFLAQFGYLEAARLLRSKGEHDAAFTLLEDKLRQRLPQSGFLPEVFRFRLQHYLGRGKDGARDAASAAEDYRDTAAQKGWPNGFLREADYYRLMVQATEGTLSGSALEGQLEGLLAKTDGAYPDIAERVKLQLAHARRKHDKHAAARDLYQSVVDTSNDPGARAEALLGLGHGYLAEGDPSRAEPYRAALLSFLRVYLEDQGVSADLRAEALYHGALACEKWRGPDSGAMARRLRGLLRRDFPDSSWARR